MRVGVSTPALFTEMHFSEKMLLFIFHWESARAFRTLPYMVPYPSALVHAPLNNPGCSGAGTVGAVGSKASAVIQFQEQCPPLPPQKFPQYISESLPNPFSQVVAPTATEWVYNVCCPDPLRWRYRLVIFDNLDWMSENVISDSLCFF